MRKIKVFLPVVLICVALGSLLYFRNKPEPLMEIKVEEGIPYGKSSHDSEWVKLGNAISPPKEWKNDDLAGRNKATTLIGVPDISAQMVSEKAGWLVVTYGRGMAAADTYVYKTSDAGKTWEECTPPALTWYVSAVGFIDENRMLIGSRLFDGAPVFFTADGGNTWEKIRQPEITAELKSVDIQDDTINMVFEDGNRSWEMTSKDFGNTWESIQQ